MDQEQKASNKGPGTGLGTGLAIRFRFLLPPHIEVLLPGLFLTSIISALALHTGAELHYVTPLISAMLMGIVLRNAFIIPPAYMPGIFYSMRQILRFAVVLLGVRITFGNITSLGWEGLTVALLPLALTMALTIALGRLLSANSSRTLLIATGTSICGASAILTAGAIIRAKEDDVIVAISSITIFGTISMLAYPALYKLGVIALTPEQYGYWTGASIHEVAQVVAAAFGGSETSGEIGIIVKLTRVAALIPVAFMLSYFAAMKNIKEGSEDQGASGVAFPFFLVGFIAMVFMNSFEFFTPKAVGWIELFDVFLLTMAMAGMGLETDFGKLKNVGLRPMILSIFATGFIAASSLALIKLLIK